MRIDWKPVFLLLLFSLLLSFPVSAAEETTLSPAIAVMQENVVLHKSVLCGEPVSFSVKDFEDLLGIERCGAVRITSLPPVTHGTLALDGKQVIQNQVIARGDIGTLKFHPTSADALECTFTFRTEGSEAYDLVCSVCARKELNYAPTVLASETEETEVRTISNITGFFRMEAEDPENDRLRFEIVSYPKKGILVQTDDTTGEYTYTPIRDYVGRDHFTFAVYDTSGNRSEEKTVTVRVEQSGSALVYSDLIGHPAQVAAITLTEKGIVSPSYDSGSPVFHPEKEVSRLDFLTMAMKTAGYHISTRVSETGLADDASIPETEKGYVRAALDLGFLPGTVIEENCLQPDASVTKAEAAVMLASMLPIDRPLISPVFADASSISAWAEDAFCALDRIGALPVSAAGEVSADAVLTREDGARMLCAILEYLAEK